MKRYFGGTRGFTCFYGGDALRSMAVDLLTLNGWGLI